jgi:hypothetical protein
MRRPPPDPDGSIALRRHVVAVDEAQRRGIDTIAQPTPIDGAVLEHMAEMAVAMGRAHFRPDHAKARVAQLAHIGRLDGLGEAGPAAAGFIFVRRCEQRFTGNDIDINPGLLVVEIFAGAGMLRAALLRHAVFFR